ncbi:response regulator [Caenimonas terrae]|uniref:Response regulator n=1 Tax=Caenimonas terrae TaxID=696074 RepID=A0ABW0N8D8_9BURK
MKILLIDDHALFRRGVRLMLRELVADVDLSEADGCAQALTMAHEAFDLILLDMNMPGLNGIEALQCIKQAWPTAFVVVLSGEENAGLIRNVIEQGASGFVPKTSTPEVMIHALQLVLSRGVYLPPQVLNASHAPGPDRQHGSAAPAIAGMTQRQAEVLRMALKGAPNKVIARELNISEGTVKSHLSTVFRLLNVRNRTQALYSVARLGLSI